MGRRFGRFGRIAFRFLLFGLIFLAASSQARAQISSRVLLCPARTANDSPYYEQVVRKRDDVPAFERAKIEYLIERLRESHLTFYRNREPHTGKEAANHVSMKRFRAGGLVKTARDFIKYIASRSSQTNQPYMVRLANGEMMPVKELLSNELEKIESLAAKDL
jgi:hypothetical protein